MNWAAMLRAAMAAGIAPEAFWRLSVMEWRALCGGGDQALGGPGLQELMARYPDQPTLVENLDPRLRGDER